ncbi:gag-Pol polyprotein [Trichonephila clavipes]|uniref:Gag-Pol polyprotein n=1 Tax=Trichonephila clavipes TaxID=2585209 RepID=A0A8X6VE64_TRICX|nr:gag-Pol polyprotein [Trichonephila clavipes]
MPRRDGPYIVLYQRSPTTFVVASCDKPDEPLGVYHTSALTPFLNGTETQSPVVPLRKRGRPRKQPLVPRGTAGENAIRSASTPPRRDGLWRCPESNKLTLSKLKRKCGTLRGVVTKQITKLESDILIPDIAVEDLEESFQLLTERGEELKLIDSQIESLIEIDGIEAEFDIVEEYRKKIMRT